MPRPDPADPLLRPLAEAVMEAVSRRMPEQPLRVSHMDEMSVIWITPHKNVAFPKIRIDNTGVSIRFGRGRWDTGPGDMSSKPTYSFEWSEEGIISRVIIAFVTMTDSALGRY